MWRIWREKDLATSLCGLAIIFREDEYTRCLCKNRVMREIIYQETSFAYSFVEMVGFHAWRDDPLSNKYEG